MLDADDAGRAATQECLKRLGRRMFVKALEVPDRQQLDVLSREEIVLLLIKGRSLHLKLPPGVRDTLGLSGLPEALVFF